MNNSKILIVGNKSKSALELYYLQYLSEIFEKVEIFEVNNYLRSNILIRIRRKLGDQLIYKNINSNLLEYIDQFKPDIIWIFKGIEISLSTLSLIKSKKIKVVNYNADHPFIRPFISSGNDLIVKAIPYYDLHFCYSKSLIEKIEKDYKINCIRLPFGFDLDDKIYEELTKVEEIQKVCFLGNPDKERAHIINYLAEKGLEIDVYGYRWGKWIKETDKIRIFPLVFDFEFWKVLRKYRVQINLFRPYNVGSHNMRTFEIPAIGGVQLAPDSVENREFFEENKEIFLYNSIDELVTKAKYILNLPKNESEIIRTAARKKSIKNDYSYKHRSEIVSNAFKLLIG